MEVDQVRTAFWRVFDENTVDSAFNLRSPRPERAASGHGR